MEPSPNPHAIGDDIERALDELRTHLEPRAYDKVVELLQLITELYGEGLRRVVDAVTGLDVVDGAPLLRVIAADELVAGRGPPVPRRPRRRRRAVGGRR